MASKESKTNTLTITAADLALLANRALVGTPLNWGWADFWVTCPTCGQSTKIEQIIGSREFLCSACGYFELEFAWPNVRQEQCHDGGWLNPIGWEKAKISLN